VQLVTIRAMVARVSDVKPLAKVVTYTCEQCGFEVYQEVCRAARTSHMLDSRAHLSASACAHKAQFGMVVTYLCQCVQTVPACADWSPVVQVTGRSFMPLDKCPAPPVSAYASMCTSKSIDILVVYEHAARAVGSLLSSL